MLYKVLRPFFVLYLKIKYKPCVIFNGIIPDNGCILVCNHSNNLDFISMGIVTKKVVHFLAKDTLFKFPLKYILRLSGVISVNRKIKDKKVIIKSLNVLNNNEIIGIFPEGTFNKTSNILAPFKIGAVKLSYESSKPIVPIAIITPYKRGKLKIIVGKRIYINSNNLEFENKKLMKIMEKMILENKEV